MMKWSFTICMLLVAHFAFAQNEKALIIKGNQLYKQKQFDKAAAEYKKATEKNEKSAEAQFNLGNSLYLSKKPDEAQKAFETAFENGAGKSMKSKAGYNKGVVLSRQNKLPESIDAYKQSLRLNSEDTDARENLQKALNELKKQQQKNQKDQNKQNNQNKDQKQNNQDQDKPEPNNSNLNQKQAERMLSALRQQEKKLQQNIQNKNNKNGGIMVKDW